jgi:hypothetical protein
VENERTAWLYVTAMHAAAVGGPRVPIRGIVEDVEDMRSQLTRERDEARARVAALEKRLARRESLARVVGAIQRSLARLAHRLRWSEPQRDSPGSPPTGDVRPTAPAAAERRRATLGSLLLEWAIVSPGQLVEAQRHLEVHGGKLSSALRHLGFVTAEEIVAALSVLHNVPSIDLRRFEVDPRVVAILRAETARNHRVLPLAVSGRLLTVAMADPGNEMAFDKIRSSTGYEVEPVVADESILEEEIERYYSAPRSLTEASSTRNDRNGLRLVWSREDPTPGGNGGGPPGAPAA